MRAKRPRLWPLALLFALAALYVVLAATQRHSGTTLYRIPRDLTGAVQLGSVLASAIVATVIARHHIVWRRTMASWNVAALEPPFQELRAELIGSLERLPAFRESGVVYRPCAVQLESGTTVDRCVLLTEEEFRKAWPGRPPIAPAVRAEHVVAIAESPATLERRLVDRLDLARRPRDGRELLLRLIFDNGNTAVVRLESFAAIPELPESRSADEVIDVVAARPGEGPVHESIPPAICVFGPGGGAAP
jgi:hypothetical protein